MADLKKKQYEIVIITCFLLAILHRLQLTDVTRQQIEQELNMVNRDKVEIIEQFQQVNIFES